VLCTLLGVTRPVDITAGDARRVALAAQGFADRRPTGRIDRRHFRKVLDRLATVQVDSVNVLARSHELVFFARLGPYDRTALTRWLWSSRDVFEYWGHEASLHPVERHPLFRWRMAEEHPWAGVRQAAAANPDLMEELLAEVRARGPLSVGEMETEDRSLGDPSTDVAAGSWWGWGAVKRVMAQLFLAGDVTAIRRPKFERVYLLPDQWLPPAVLTSPSPDKDEAHRALLQIAARALGLGTAGDLADYYRLRMPTVKPLLDKMVTDGELLPARVQGWRQAAYLHPEAHLPRRRLRARALLAVRLADLAARAERAAVGLRYRRERSERLWGFATASRSTRRRPSGCTATTCCPSCWVTSSWAGSTSRPTGKPTSSGSKPPGRRMPPPPPPGTTSWSRSSWPRASPRWPPGSASWAEYRFNPAAIWLPSCATLCPRHG
jgi:uncharacterized protein YcaQ